MLIAPHFIDWTAYRADFEREASRILGQRVVVRGAASARLLPFPSVTFTEVEVEGAADAGPMMTARQFRMDAELAPYLSGEVRIFSMRIEEPVLHVPVGPDGRLVFMPQGGSLPTAATVVLEDVTIADGTILVDDAGSGVKAVLSKIDGTFAAQSLAGPMSGGGTLAANGRPLAFQLSSGVAEAGSGLPLKLTVDDRTLKVSATVDGLAKLADGVPRFEGTLRAASVIAPKESDAEGKGAEVAAAPDDAALPVFAVTAKLASGPQAVDVSDMRLSVGGGEKPYVLTGSGSLSGGAAPSFALVLNGEQVDIDAIATGDGPKRAVTFAERLEAARRVFDTVPKPAIPGTVKLTLPVVIAGDTTIRDLGVDASPAADGWSLRRFRAEFPGRTRMEASGSLDLAGSLRFRGSLLVAARQPSGFSEWLTGKVEPSIRTLGQAGFSATVDLSPERQSFDDLALDVGGDKLAGRLERSGPQGGRTIAADLRGGRLDLDAFVALSRLFTGESDSLADARHGSLKVAAGPVVYGGTAADRIDADLAFDGRTLAIDHAEIRGLAGSDIVTKGSLSDLGGDVSGQIEVRLASSEPAALVDFLSARLPPSPALEFLRRRAPALGPMTLAGTLHTTPGGPGERPTLDVDITGKAAKTDLSVAVLLGNGIYAGGEAGRFGLDLSMTSGEPAELLGQMGIETLPLALPAPLGLKVSLSAGTTGPVAASAALRAPGSEMTAEGTLGVTAAGLDTTEIALSARSDDLAPWLLATGNAFGATGADALPASFGAAATYEGGTLALKGVEGSLGSVDMTADLERAGDGPVTGDVFVSRLSAPWLAALVYGQPPVDQRFGRWSKAGFGQTFQTLPRFAVDVTTDRLDLGKSAAAGDASAHVEGKPGEVSLTDIRGALGGGYGTGSLQFRNADGVGAFSASADLQGLDLGTLALAGFTLPDEDEAEEAATVNGPQPGVYGTLDARLQLDATGQSYAGLVSAMTGAGNVHVEDGGFAGIKPGLFGDLLTAANRDGFDAGPVNVARLVAEATGSASYPVPSAVSDFSVIGGLARFSAVRLDRPGERLTAEGAIDLAAATVSGTLRLDLDPGDEAVEGAAPSIEYALSGPIGVPTLAAGVQPLANYLSVRALEREQARVEAIQGALQEKLRLRREARLYRWREERRLDAEAVARAGEESRLEQARRLEEARAEAARRAEEEREAAERAAVEKRREAAERAAADRRRAEAEQAREAERRRASTPVTPTRPPVLDFEPPPSNGPATPDTSSASPTLPGVRDPFEF